MGRRALKMEKIEDKQRRTVTFCKRSKGLFKKAKSLCDDFPGIQIAVITFSPLAGNPYTWASSTTADSSSSSSSSCVDSMIDRYLHLHQNTNSTTATTTTTPRVTEPPIGDKKKKRKRSEDLGSLGFSEQQVEQGGDDDLDHHQHKKKRENEGHLGFHEKDQPLQELPSSSNSYSSSSVLLDNHVDAAIDDDDEKREEGFWLDEITGAANQLEEDELRPCCCFTLEELLGMEQSDTHIDANEVYEHQHHGDDDEKKLQEEEEDNKKKREGFTWLLTDEQQDDELAVAAAGCSAHSSSCEFTEEELLFLEATMEQLKPTQVVDHGNGSEDDLYLREGDGFSIDVSDYI